MVSVRVRATDRASTCRVRGAQLSPAPSGSTSRKGLPRSGHAVVHRVARHHERTCSAGSAPPPVRRPAIARWGTHAPAPPRGASARDTRPARELAPESGGIMGSGAAWIAVAAHANPLAPGMPVRPRDGTARDRGNGSYRPGRHAEMTVLTGRTRSRHRLSSSVTETPGMRRSWALVHLIRVTAMEADRLAQARPRRRVPPPQATSNSSNAGDIRGSAGAVRPLPMGGDARPG